MAKAKAKTPAPLTPSSSRRLLKNIREFITAKGPADKRLQECVFAIAEAFDSPVCSVYASRPGDMLELYATVGLDKKAVHATRLRFGEGLIGTIAATAKPLSVGDGFKHPSFAYRPETDEDKYHAFAGVPILAGGRVMGVLAVQDTSCFEYPEEDVENLENISILLSSLLTGGELIPPQEQMWSDGNALLPLKLHGTSIHRGLSIGKAWLHRPLPDVSKLLAEHPAQEQQKLSDALAAVQHSLDALLSEAEGLNAAEPVEILETYRLFAHDRGWQQRMRDAIETGLSAAAAIQRVHNETRVRMNQIADPYLRERLSDLEDLTSRLLLHVLGKNAKAEPPKGEDFIIVARDLGPAALLEFDRTHVKGLILEEGSQTSHVAIVARALDIPVLGQIEQALSRIETGDILIIDGGQDEAYIRPGEDVVQIFRQSLNLREKQKLAYATLKTLPAITLDGVPVALYINAGLMMDMDQLEAQNADGVGLFRTEIPFMVQGRFPTVSEQTELYRTVLERAGSRPVVFRTLDVGGDKVLPYMRKMGEENPAMGWRGMRVSLDTPAILRQQLRALLRAAAGKKLHVMFPMVAEVAEFITARQLLQSEMEEAQKCGKDLPAHVAVGVMVEVPSIVWQLPSLLPRVDFLSVGSNDLLQFTFASDRGSAKMGGRYDPLSPAFLSLLRQIVTEADQAGVPVTLCGEMASQPLEAMALLGLGMHRLSLSSTALGPIKALIRQVNITELKPYVHALLASTNHSLRGNLAAFARDHGVLL
ncbi:MAG: phosphoenolpyruvate--protein phosphotransferase [Dongiaceae bacterium]